MKLASIFTDHIIFQKGERIKIFGEGEGNGSIEFLGKTVGFCSGDDEWCVSLPPQEYGGPYEMKIVLNGEESILKDIYIGEVWLAAGQSNMALPLFKTEYGFEQAQGCEDDKIRFFTVPRRMKKDVSAYSFQFEPVSGDDMPWQLCDEESALHFSAIGYYVAKKLRKELGCAVGIISCNWGGKPIETFIGREWVKRDEKLKDIYDDFEKRMKDIDYDEYYEKFIANVEENANKIKSWGVSVIDEARKRGIRATTGVEVSVESSIPPGIYNPYEVGVLYESMISRIIPFGIKGILWYQGESGSCERFLEKYLLFAKCMRESFEKEDLPIYSIELAPHIVRWNFPVQDRADRFVTGENWAFKRETQQKATAYANNYLITSMELGDPYDIHPIHKAELSNRAARKILKYSYGFDIAADQPTLRKATFKGREAVLEFDNAKELYFGEGGNFVNIYLADDERQLKKADIKIDGNKLILSSSEIENPTIARYGFDEYYIGAHIYNEAGLPMAPFRTDTFI